MEPLQRDPEQQIAEVRLEKEERADPEGGPATALVEMWCNGGLRNFHLIIILLLFIFERQFLRKRSRQTQRWGGGGRERETPKQAPSCQHEARHGA